MKNEIINPDEFLAEFEKSREIAQKSDEDIYERYNNFAKFISSNNCKIKGERK